MWPAIAHSTSSTGGRHVLTTTGLTGITAAQRAALVGLDVGRECSILS